MTRTKNAIQTVESIIEISAKLFAEKGYERTTMQEIVDGLGMSKGAIFHHFDSKEEIAQAVAERFCGAMLDAAERTAADTGVPLYERLIKTLLTLQVSDGGGRQMLFHLHSHPNALIHMMMEKIILEKVTPILAGIVREGTAQGLFDTRYPEETVEMILCYANSAFDVKRIAQLSAEETEHKVSAFIESVERLTGAKKGGMDILRQIITGAEDSNERHGHK